MGIQLKKKVNIHQSGVARKTCVIESNNYIVFIRKVMGFYPMLIEDGCKNVIENGLDCFNDWI